MDQVLESFLASPDERRSEEQLGDLLARYAAPIVRRVVSRRLGSTSDVDDVCSQVTVQLMLRLRREKIDANLTAIDAFASYVATAAHHGADHYIRAKYPLRWRLRSRLRYVLEHDPHFAVWKTAEGSWICGLAEWRSRQAAGALPSGGRLADIPKQNVRQLLGRVFQLSGGPLELNAVADVAAFAWAIPLLQHDHVPDINAVPAREPHVELALEQRGRLERIWTQIRDLPLRQRHALLLNLRDDALTLFVTTGAASLREIAAVLELPMADFAALWNDLPLPDNALAIRLGCTRQQVINLRMAARKRLGNRLQPKANIDAERAL